MSFFTITSQSSTCQARAGIIHTAHGDIETPVFMPVGTQATVKALDSQDLVNLNAQIILANTYHLHLRPGEDLVAEMGGLHKFMNWNRPILTDSGGFQVFSLSRNTYHISRTNESKEEQTTSQNLIQDTGYGIREGNQGRLVSIDDDGVTFHSHIDGTTHRFTPESAIEIQHKLGADIIMAFDECTPDRASLDCARQAMERTHGWAERCLKYHETCLPRLLRGNMKHVTDNTGRVKKNMLHDTGYMLHEKQALFGIIQGANYENLRKQSAEFISSLPFDGIAIGGESVGFNMEATKQILDWVGPIIPADKPHYTMGLGHSPLDLFEVVERGVDMFDCVSPTRMARNGALFVHKEISPKYRINITKSEFKNDQSPIDPACTCSTCANYSRAYINHLFRAEELLAYRLATIHNVHFFLNLMGEIRKAIREDRFGELKKEWLGATD